MNQKSNEYIAKVVNQIVDKIDPYEVILFGSYGRGDPSKDSDLDLCILMENGSKRKLEIMREVRRGVSPIVSIPLDVLVYELDDFKKREKRVSSFEHKIRNEGISQYEQ